MFQGNAMVVFAYITYALFMSSFMGILVLIYLFWGNTMTGSVVCANTMFGVLQIFSGVVIPWSFLTIGFLSSFRYANPIWYWLQCFLGSLDLAYRDVNIQMGCDSDAELCDIQGFRGYMETVGLDEYPACTEGMIVYVVLLFVLFGMGIYKA